MHADDYQIGQPQLQLHDRRAGRIRGQGSWVYCRNLLSATVGERSRIRVLRKRTQHLNQYVRIRQSDTTANNRPPVRELGALGSSLASTFVVVQVMSSWN